MGQNLKIDQLVQWLFFYQPLLNWLRSLNLSVGEGDTSGRWQRRDGHAVNFKLVVNVYEMVVYHVIIRAVLVA